MSPIRLLHSAVLLNSIALVTNLPAATDSPETMDFLRQRIEELDQKVRVLERKDELASEASVEKARSATSVSAGAGGFSIRSADTNFVLKLRGYVQADARFYPDDHAAGTANDTFLLRRVRPIIEGTVHEKYDFRVMLDFGSGATSSSANNAYVQDAYLNARFLPQFQVAAGKFKEPVGLERLQSGANLLFVERGLPTQLVPNRDVGFMIQGDGWDGVLNYAIGAFNGVADGGSADIESGDDEKDVAARIFSQPFRKAELAALRGVGFGLAGTYGEQEGTLRTFSSPGQQRFFAYRTSTTPATAPNVLAEGLHWRVTPQGYYYWGAFGLFGEYVISDQEVVQAGAGSGSGDSAGLRNTAWQVAASYFLTGEENSWKAVTPRKPFSPAKGGWGAWELAARIGELEIDDDAFPIYASETASARKAFSWGVGLNWHLNRNVKVNLNYDQTDFKGGTTELLREGEKAVFARAQISF